MIRHHVLAYLLFHNFYYSLDPFICSFVIPYHSNFFFNPLNRLLHTHPYALTHTHTHTHTHTSEHTSLFNRLMPTHSVLSPLLSSSILFLVLPFFCSLSYFFSSQSSVFSTLLSSIFSPLSSPILSASSSVLFSLFAP